MKRTLRDRDQPSVVPGHNTAPLKRNQILFRNQNESQSVNKAQIRNNNLQLSFSRDQVNPASLSSFGVPRGQSRPHSAGLNQHQLALPTSMNGFSRLGGGGWKITKFLQPRYLNIRSPGVNNYSRVNPARFPSTTHQFQETQRNARFTQQRKYVRHSSSTSNISTSDRTDTKNKERGHLDKNQIYMHRKWEALREANQCRADEFSFNLVTYNILSDALLNENIYLYEECSGEALDWEYRKRKLLHELLGYDAEILCLQEVEACHYENWFLPKLREAGYAGVFNQRTGGKPDGCAIFYRNAKFTLEKHKLVKYFTPNVYVLDKDNVGIVLLLKANTPGPENSFICVANTHLLFNKKRGDIKLAQLAYLFAEIDDLAVLSQDGHKKTHCPVILCGDLNSLPYSPLYHFLNRGLLDYSARSPAVISGQLAPSEASGSGRYHKRHGQSARLIHTPLLPWEFGVTSECQWREQCQVNSKGSHTNSLCSDTAYESNMQTSRVQDSESNTSRQNINNAEDCHDFPSQQRCKSNNPTQVHPSRHNETFRHVDSVPDFHSNTGTASREVDDSKKEKDSTTQTNPGTGRCNRELREPEVKAADTSEMGGFNRFDRRTVVIRHSEYSRDPGSNHNEQRQRQQDHVQSCSRGEQGGVLSKDVKSNSDLDWTTDGQSRKNSDLPDLRRNISPRSVLAGLARDSNRPAVADGEHARDPDRITGRRSNANSNVIDLTRDSNSPSYHNMVAEENRVGDHHSDPKYDKPTESNRHDHFNTPSSTASARPTDRRSKANSNIIDLTTDTDSSSYHNLVTEPSRVGDSHSGSNYDKSSELNRHDTPSSTSSARPTDLETERTKHNKNGIISIPWKFTSVYSHRFPDGSPEVTTCHSRACCNVDYILYTAGIRDRQSTGHREYIQTGKLTLLGRLELMRKTDFNRMKLLPNHIFPSDHLSLLARFKLS